MRAAFSYPGSGLFLVGGDILPQSLHWGGRLTGKRTSRHHLINARRFAWFPGKPSFGDTLFSSHGKPA